MDGNYANKLYDIASRNLTFFEIWDTIYIGPLWDDI